MNSDRKGVWAAVALAAAMMPLPSARADEGLRIVNWNISNYAGGRVADLQTAIYGVFEGRSMSPDVLVAEEITSGAAMNSLLGVLNAAAGSPGDWAAGPFVDGPDSDSAIFYRTSKVKYLGMSVLPADPGTTGSPRNVYRYDLGLVGFSSPETTLALYSVHMKAGSGSDDQARRLVEARKIRDDAEALDPAVNTVLLGDFNVQSSSQSAYLWLTGSQVNNAGRFADPIASPGSWNNNANFRFIHTQDPSGAGGMDDRHDQILVDYDLGDGEGLDYLGRFGVPYSTTTWDDAHHSYRAWGNDGTSFNAGLTTIGNTMVGPEIAQALRAVAVNGGHLPVFLNLIVPATVSAEHAIDLGNIPFGSAAAGELSVGNGGHVALWGVGGIQDLQYTLEAGAGLSLDPGPYVDAAGGDINTHAFTANLATDPSGGVMSGRIIIHSNDPDVASLTVTVSGNVVGCSPADFAVPFGTFDFFDIQEYLEAFSFEQPEADITGDGEFNFFDVQEFLDLFAAGCP